ncbi:MAG: nucleotide disphospho-sugar-binding domain-containing protein [Micropruina sp.]
MATSVLICASSLDGHVMPMLAAARELVAAGMAVQFLADEKYADAVAASGAVRVALPEEAQTNEALLKEGTATDGRRLSGLEQAIKSVRLSFVNQIPAQFGALTSAIEAGRPDVVVTESTFLGAAVLALRPREQRPAILTCNVIPLTLFSKDTAPPGFGLAPMPGVAGRLRNLALNLVVRRLVFGGLQREINEHAKALAGRPLNDFFLDTGRSAEAFVQFTVPSFEYPRSDAPPNLVFLGPSGGPVHAARPLPDWWDDLDGNRPLVHVSQGTIANLDFDELVKPTIDALAAEDVLVVVSGGGRTLDALGPLPDNVRTADFLDYTRLMPLVDVFVTNGGYGSMHAALACGVPIVVAGDTEDKVESSARVSWSGVGINLRTGTPTPDAIRTAVRKVLADPHYRENAERVRHDIADSPGAKGLAPIIERLRGSAAPPARRSKPAEDQRR